MVPSLVAISTLAAIVLLIAAIVKLLPGFTQFVVGDGARRVYSLDGLRAILALSVVVHHSGVMQNWVVTRQLTAPSTNFLNQLGSTAVALFFMVSGYLFCGALLRNEGKVDILRLFEGRLMRIVPLYLACVVTLFFVVGVETDFVLREPLSSLIRNSFGWLLMGFSSRGPINGFSETFLLFSQIWTLRYEWLLYLSLPFLGLSMRLCRTRFALYALLIAASLVSPLFAYFATGAAATELKQYNGPWARQGWQVAGIAGLFIELNFFHDAAGWPQAMLLTPFFVAISQGTGLFARFGVMPLRFLGEISYSIYLVHAFVLWIITHWLIDPLAYGGLGPVTSWLAFTGIGVASVAVSTASFCLIERPLMHRRPLTGRRAATPAVTVVEGGA